MKFKPYYELFKKLPKITNNHVHIFAMYPYNKILRIIQKIDPSLYSQIYILKENIEKDNIKIIKNTLNIYNSQNQGKTFKEITSITDWERLEKVKALEIKNIVTISSKSPDPWKELEDIQLRVRVFVRNYKVYYYYWYATLRANYKHHVYYLNVRGKPGTINRDVQHGTRLFQMASNRKNFDDFVRSLRKIARESFSPNDLRYLYNIYGFVKYESDLILLAIKNFNQNKNKTTFIENSKLLNFEIKPKFFNQNEKDPDMMVQYIITFPKPIKDKTDYDHEKELKTIKFYMYAAIIINQEYEFPFFNGLDFVGSEETTDNKILMSVIHRMNFITKHGIKIIPHFGEVNNLNQLSSCKNYMDLFIKEGINRIGHGLILSQSNDLINNIKKDFYIEFCPLSNAILKFYSVKDNPHKKLINHPYLKLVICSDDNGLFKYSTVTHDYIALHHYWKLDFNVIKQLIMNGIDLIPEKHKNYYLNWFNKLWLLFINKTKN